MSRNTKLWLHGLGAALVGGGSGAVSAVFGVNMIDPKDWNLSTVGGLAHMGLLMVVVFVINGAITAFAWLSKNPVPALDDQPEVK